MERGRKEERSEESSHPFRMKSNFARNDEFHPILSKELDEASFEGD
jgi:hypothetical protein